MTDKRIGTILFSVFVNLALIVANIWASEWTIETVDSNGDVGQYSSIAVDSLGSAYISYYDNTNYNLKYATNASGSWVTTTVDSKYVGWYSSIVLDSSEKVHISYYDYSNNKLKYTNNTSGLWVIKTIDNGGGKYSSVAVDSLDMIHISYKSGRYYSTKYATNTSGTWTTTIVDNNFDPVYNSIALDSSHKAHISNCYLNNGTEWLAYSTNDSDLWTMATIDECGYPDYGGGTSIIVDNSGNAHISYYGIDNRHIDNMLKYATNKYGSWETTTIDDSVEDVGQYSSIAQDYSDKIHISYYDKTNGDLKYATNEAGYWVTSTVDSNGNVGQYSSIAVDKSGKIQISYYDATNGNLKCATKVVHSTPSTTPTPTPKSTPTPVASLTPLPTVCEPESIFVDTTTLNLKRWKSGDVIVTVTGEYGCAVEGETVTATIDAAGKRRVSVSPTSTSTDENGQATFTITAKKFTGNAKVTLKAGSVKKSMTVRVRDNNYSF